MEHIGNHPLACVDENGIVFNIVDMWEHTQNAYDACVFNNPAAEYVIVCEKSTEPIYIGQQWDGTKFLPFQ